MHQGFVLGIDFKKSCYLIIKRCGVVFIEIQDNILDLKGRGSKESAL